MSVAVSHTVCTYWCISIGCGDETTQGPHTTRCLKALWKDAGCLQSGRLAPRRYGAYLAGWWNAKTVDDVRKDMSVYYRRAISGSARDKHDCFGLHSHKLIVRQDFSNESRFALNSTDNYWNAIFTSTFNAQNLYTLYVKAPGDVE